MYLRSLQCLKLSNPYDFCTGWFDSTVDKCKLTLQLPQFMVFPFVPLHTATLWKHILICNPCSYTRRGAPCLQHDHQLLLLHSSSDRSTCQVNLTVTMRSCIKYETWAENEIQFLFKWNGRSPQRAESGCEPEEMNLSVVVSLAPFCGRHLRNLTQPWNVSSQLRMHLRI